MSVSKCEFCEGLLCGNLFYVTFLSWVKMLWPILIQYWSGMLSLSGRSCYSRIVVGEHSLAMGGKLAVPG